MYAVCSCLWVQQEEWLCTHICNRFFPVSVATMHIHVPVHWCAMMSALFGEPFRSAVESDIFKELIRYFQTGLNTLCACTYMSTTAGTFQGSCTCELCVCNPISFARNQG